MTDQNVSLDHMRTYLKDAFNDHLGNRLSALIEPTKENLLAKEPYTAMSVHQGSLYFSTT